MTRSWLLAALGILGACSAPPAAPPPSSGPDPKALYPFKIALDESVLADLRDRLSKTRFPDQIPGSGWTYGADLKYLVELCQYWRAGFDWRAQERRLNAFDQWTTMIDGLPLHFIHQKSKHPSATPLVLVHGWPGSVAEFARVIRPLTDPESFGGKAEDAFHVICPSLPGFGFSGKPQEPGWDVGRISATILELMNRLGYPKYGVQGGDWGAAVATWLGQNDPRVIGIHLNFLTVGPQDAAPGVPIEPSPEESDRMKRRAQELQDHRAYGAIQATRPLTLGTALNDSPAGLAAWVVDKFWAWSDHGGNLDSSFSRDEILTNLTIYWATQSMPSSMRLYYEGQHPRPRAPEREIRRDVPVGVAIFPKELTLPPRKWAEKVLHIVRWTEMPRGGHFAALEQPGLLVEDVRAFFRELRQEKKP
ncbi:MAG TPA: epoxide hydrolase [Planctomycetota bacterium]|nr:epoxide hydrolase [Planctomycetota bacterium]